MPSSDFDVVTGPPAPSRRPVAPAGGPVKPPAAGEDPPPAFFPPVLPSSDPEAISDRGTGERR